MRTIKLRTEEGMTDQEIRETARKSPNGEYATEICKGCGSYKVDPEGNLTKAKIVGTCRECVVLV
jgi:hypothetical protein